MNISNKNSLYWRTGIDNKGLTMGTAEAKGILSSFSRQVTGMDVFAGLGVSVGLAMGKIIKDSTEMSRQFEHAMKEVQTISVATQGDFQGMSDAIIKLSTEVPENAIGLARAFYEVASAGYDGAEALRLVEVAAKAAVGGVTTTQVAVDGLTTVLNSWRLSTEQATRVSDIMFKTVEIGKIKFDQLSTEMAIVAPLAASMGVPFEQIGAAIATLTSTGTKASTAFMQLRSIFPALSENLGEGWAKTMTLQQALQKLYEKAGGSEMALKNMGVRLESIGAVFAMTGMNAEVAAKHLDKTTHSAGAAAAAFAIMAEDSTNAMTLIQNRFVAKLKPIGDYFKDAMMGMANIANDVLFEVNNEFTRAIDLQTQLANSYTRRIAEIDKYSSVIEQLRGKQNLSNSENMQLLSAYDALKILIPQIINNWEDETTALINLNLIKAESVRLTEEQKRKLINIAETEKKLIEVNVAEKKRAYEEAKNIADKSMELNERAREDVEKYISALIDGQFFRRKYSLPQAILDRIKELREQISGEVGRTGTEFALRPKETVPTISQGEAQAKRQAIIKDAIESSGIITKRNEDAIKSTNNLSLEIQKLENRYFDLTNTINDLNKTADESKIISPPPGPPPNTVKPEDQIADIQKRIDIYRQYSNSLASIAPEIQARLKDVWLAPKEAMEELENLRAQLKGNVEDTRSIDSIIAGIQVEQAKAIEDAAQAFADQQKQRQDDAAALYEAYAQATSTDRENELDAIEKYYGDLISQFEEYSAEAINLRQVMNDKLREAQDKHIREDFQKDYADAMADISAKTNEEEIKLRIVALQKLKEKYKGYAAGIIKLDKEIADSQNQLAQNTEKQWQKIASNLAHVAGVVGSYNKDLGETLRIISDVADVVDMIKSGDAFGSITSGFAIFASIFDQLFKRAHELDKVLDSMNKRLEEQRRAFEQAFGQERVDQLQRLIETTRAYMDEIAKRITAVKGVSVEERLRGQEEWYQMRGDLLDLVDDFKEMMTGTTRESIVNGIFQGFEDGREQSELFAQTFGDLMKQALLDNFKRQLMTRYLDQWYDLFAKYSEDSLTPAEIKTLEESFRRVVGWGEAYWEQIKNIMQNAGLDDLVTTGGNRTGLSGAISGMSEETAGLLAGQFNAIRMNTVDLIDIAEKHLIETGKIVKNTEYNRYLESIDRKLGAITSNTDLARTLGG